MTKFYSVEVQFRSSVGYCVVVIDRSNLKLPEAQIFMEVGDRFFERTITFDASTFQEAKINLLEKMYEDSVLQLQLFYQVYVESLDPLKLSSDNFASGKIVECEIAVLRHHRERGSGKRIQEILNKIRDAQAVGKIRKLLSI